MTYNCNHNPRLSIKVGKLKNIFTFNLIAVETCPGRTKLCEASCYARGGNYGTKKVQNMYKANLEASKCDCFVDRMIALIEHEGKYVTIHKHKVLRWHTSGDFYSELYYKKCLKIFAHFPQYTFYAYTRNPRLDLENIPSNFIVFYSTDITTDKMNPTANRFSVMLPEHTDSVNVDHLTPYDQGFICKSNRCDLCKFCWEKEGDVYFPQKFKFHEIKTDEVYEVKSIELEIFA